MSVKSNLNEQGLMWFHTTAGQCLLDSENKAIDQLLAAQPCGPWLWIGIEGAQASEEPYGIRLFRRFKNLNEETVNFSENLDIKSSVAQISGFFGDARCDLPLPFASDSFGIIFLQHVLDDGRDWYHLLSECERLLMPGGVLWLACINPHSAYRFRSFRRGLHAQSTTHWRRYLKSAGFDPATTSLQWLGPKLRCSASPDGIGAFDFLRAVTVLTARKMKTARIGGSKVQANWRPRLASVNLKASRNAAKVGSGDGRNVPSLYLVSADANGHGKLDV